MRYFRRPYVPAAQRHSLGKKAATRLSKESGRPAAPVVIEGRAIAKSFWGCAWCDHLEAFSDYANRLPRGRTYARNGSVIDLHIQPGQVNALVQGSSLYRISIRFQPMPADRWTAFTQRSAGKVTNLVDLLQGRLSKEILTDVTQRDTGLFPAPSEIKMSCSCPDWAEMCKHVAAVLYGVGARLDHQPELLFQLRGVEVAELVAAATASAAATLPGDAQGSAHPALAGEDLGALFGVELDDGNTAPRSTEPTPRDGLRSPAPDVCDPPPDALPATETDPPAIGEATSRKVQVGRRPRTRKATTTQKTGDRAQRANSTAKRPKTRATTRRAGVQKAPAKKATRATVGRRAKARSKD
jgi:uncharacterized Zn finger protein